MLEYAGSQRAGLQRNREGLAIGTVLRSLDWVLVAGVAGLIAVGLWAISGVTRFDVTGDPSHYLQRQIVYVVVGGFALAIGVLVDPDMYRRGLGPGLFRPGGGGAVGCLGGPGGPGA